MTTAIANDLLRCSLGLTASRRGARFAAALALCAASIGAGGAVAAAPATSEAVGAEAGAPTPGAASGTAPADPAGSTPPATVPPGERVPRSRDASWSQIWGGPFTSSRLFAMPVASIVGAYQLSLSGDASLVNEGGVLSTSSVVALGFGDIAQLEYRNSAAVTTLDREQIGLPSLGVQLAAPFALPRPLTGLAVALRFGLPQPASPDGGVTDLEQRATDLYLVGALRLSSRAHLHAGLRISDASLTEISAMPPREDRRTLLMPAVGIEVALERRTSMAAEFALVPRFDPLAEALTERIATAAFGRAGIRWRLLPSVIFDASIGYRIEVNRVDAGVSEMANAFVDWDIRLGGEIFVPWGAVACRATGLFCE